jgi:hypothetical protein
MRDIIASPVSHTTMFTFVPMLRTFRISWR